jgi:hypothetical protein
MADSTRDRENIVPSLGGFQTRRHALRSIAWAIKARAALTQLRSGVCQKGAGVRFQKTPALSMAWFETKPEIV